MVVGTTRVGARRATSVRLRASETNLGNLVADAMRAEVGADIAIVNAGGIRGDRVYPGRPADAAHARSRFIRSATSSARSRCPGA